MAAYDRNITADEIRESLIYDDITGIFIHAKRKQGAEKGGVAGHVDSSGYRVLSVGGRSIPAHHVAWFLCHGEWPRFQIDHIDRVKDNNAIDNLRYSTPVENTQNILAPNRGKKGPKYRGVHFCGAKFEAILSARGKKHRMGPFDTEEEAHQAYRFLKAMYHEGDDGGRDNPLEDPWIRLLF